MEEAAK